MTWRILPGSARMRPTPIIRLVPRSAQKQDGSFTGVNVENAAYPQTMCAERVAIFKAVSEGEKEFEVITVVTDNGGSPCGGCRQVMAEFGLDTIVIMADGSGHIVKETTVKELLPEAFTPEHLEKQVDKWISMLLVSLYTSPHARNKIPFLSS